MFRKKSNTFWWNNVGTLSFDTDDQQAGHVTSSESGLPTDRRLAGSAAQGRLFPLETATGRRDDPLTPMSRRVELARQRYRFADDPDSAELAEEVARSSIPSHELAGQGPRLGPGSARRTMGGKYPDDPDERLLVQAKALPGGLSGGYNPRNHEAIVPQKWLPKFGEKSNRTRNDTLVHEIGHGEHLLGVRAFGLRSSAVGPDPLVEGVADGFRDAYNEEQEGNSPWPTTVADAPVRWWRPDGNPTVRHEHLSTREQPYGSNFSGAQVGGESRGGWENDTQRALYAAARQQVATSGTPLSTQYHMEQETDGVISYPQFSGVPSNEEREAANHEIALGRLVHESPEVRDMFQMVGTEHTRHWQDMRNAASDALSVYRDAVHLGDAEHGRRPKGPEAGWMASDEGMRRHNEAVQSATLPLVDPETGQQYDNTVQRPEHPLPRI